MLYSSVWNNCDFYLLRYVLLLWDFYFCEFTISSEQSSDHLTRLLICSRFSILIHLSVLVWLCGEQMRRYQHRLSWRLTSWDRLDPSSDHPDPGRQATGSHLAQGVLCQAARVGHKSSLREPYNGISFLGYRVRWFYIFWFFTWDFDIIK